MKNNKEKLPDAVCPGCEMPDVVFRFYRREMVEIHGVTVEVTKVLRSCETCGAEFENSSDGDWRPAAYHAASKLLREENVRLREELQIVAAVDGGMSTEIYDLRTEVERLRGELDTTRQQLKAAITKKS